MRDITQKTLTLIVLVTFSTFPVHAGVSKDMSNFFNKFGASSNHTKGSSYQDQSGGYYNGGALFGRVFLQQCLDKFMKFSRIDTYQRHSTG